MFALIYLFIFFVSSNAQQCWIEGTCEDGITIGASVVSSKEECLEVCKSDEDCSWFTHFSSDSICVKFSECLSVSTESCDDCISGERICLPQYECWIGGICQGSFVSAFASTSPDDCLKGCKESEVCKWFSFEFDEDGGNVCTLLEDCITLDEDCAGCFSGQKECKPRGKKLLVATGNDFDKDDKVEIVHIIEDSNVTSECQYLPKYPVSTRGAIGAALGPNRFPTICGGYLNADFGRDCYQLKEVSKGWEQIASMKEKRGNTGYTVFNGSLWVTGGGYEFLTTSEIYNAADNIWVFGPDLPEGRGYDRHCLLTLNESTAFLIGGNTNDTTFSTKTWFFHLGQDNWIPGPELSVGRYGHACGVLRAGDGSPTKVVVVSGYATDPSGLTSTTEILDLDSNIWSFGPPITAYGAGMAEDGDGGLFLVGGRLDSASRVDKIFLFRVGFQDWKLLPQRLKTRKEYPVTFVIPDHMTNCS